MVTLLPLPGKYAQLGPGTGSRPALRPSAGLASTAEASAALPSRSAASPVPTTLHLPEPGLPWPLACVLLLPGPATGRRIPETPQHHSSAGGRPRERQPPGHHHRHGRLGQRPRPRPRPARSRSLPLPASQPASQPPPAGSSKGLQGGRRASGSRLRPASYQGTFPLSCPLLQRRRRRRRRRSTKALPCPVACYMQRAGVG